MCYYPEAGSKDELSLSEIGKIAKKYRGCAFVLGGREPTMRQDLDEVIRVISPYVSVLILTNGLKLSDQEYLMSLKDAGLDGVIFSFNGMDDEAYQALDGRRHLDEKWKTFETLKRSKVPTIMSMTVARGINCEQVGEVIRLCQDNTDFIKELRLRAVRPLGGFLDGSEDLLLMSDLVDLLIEQTDFKHVDLLRGIDFWHELGGAFGVDAFRPRLCTIEFTTRLKRGKWYPEGALLSPAAETVARRWSDNKLARPFYLMVLLRQMVRFYGLKPVFRRLTYLKGRFNKCTTPSHRLKLRVFADRKDLLQITLKSWPVSKQHLGSEKLKCSTLFISHNECSLFCARNIETNSISNRTKTGQVGAKMVKSLSP
jgi:hypothetical protein